MKVSHSPYSVIHDVNEILYNIHNAYVVRHRLLIPADNYETKTTNIFLTCVLKFLSRNASSGKGIIHAYHLIEIVNTK